MIVVKLQGGLGNQMFQYAFAKSLSLRKKESFLLDTNDFNYDQLRDFELAVFDLNAKVASNEIVVASKTKKLTFFSKLINKLTSFSLNPKSTIYIEESLDYYPEVVFAKANYYEGYWQTENYFIQFEKEIRKDFNMKIKANDYYSSILQLAVDKESVSVHFRRGDFVNNTQTNEFHGLCDIDYYKNAMSYFKNKLGKVTFFMISDDIEWVKNQFKFENDIIFIENFKGKDYEDMRLMSQCKHNIIANSSFSWWGAWLNNNPAKIVISPKRWFNNEEKQQQTKDLIPENWIKL